MRRGALGFTLFELLVVLVIVAIGAAVTVVSVGRGIAGDPGRRFAVDLSRMVRAAKVQAMNEGVPAVLCLDPVERQVYILGEVQRVFIPQNLRIEAEGVLRNDRTDACVYFFPDGSSTGARLKVTRDGVVLVRLHIDAVTGTVTVYSVNGAGRERG